MKIIGISAFYHDSAAVLIENGEILYAIQEERFSRIKNDPSFPTKSIQYILEKSNCVIDDIDYFIFYEKPFLKFHRILETQLRNIPWSWLNFIKSIPLWIGNKLFQENIIRQELVRLGASKDLKLKLFFSEHHLSHAASAFFPSPFEEALVITLDGVGEWATASVSLGKDNKLTRMKEIDFPDSLGLLYSAITQILGFKVNSGEYKVMGLAPYGEPVFYELIRSNVIDIKNDGSFRLNQAFFNYQTGLSMASKKLLHLFGLNSFRNPAEEILEVHQNIAASIQKVVNEIFISMGKDLLNEYGVRNICLAGGVALNCVANGELLRETDVSNIWIQPAAGDAGGALGAALAFWHLALDAPRQINKPDSMKNSFLGTSFSNPDVAEDLEVARAIYNFVPEDLIFDKVAKELADGKIVGWFQGAMEFGPRALGARSILADPRDPEMQQRLNLKTKFRESFRPFAPAVIEEDLNLFFDLACPSPYMLLVDYVKESLRVSSSMTAKKSIQEIRSVLPSITHVDFSARIQTVSKETNHRFYSLLNKFKSHTGIGVLVNTSFNLRGEPIVSSPLDAYRCFMSNDIDVLVIENYVLHKSDQPHQNKLDYRKSLHED